MKNKIKILMESIYQINSILDYKQKRRCLLVFIITLVGSFFELLGVSSILPFIEMLTDTDVMNKNKFLVFVGYMFGFKTISEMTIMVGIVIVLIFFLKNLFLLFSSYQQCSLNADINKQLSDKMLKSYMSRPYAFFVNNSRARIVNGVNLDTTGVYIIISALFRIMAESSSCLFIFILLMLVDILFALGLALLAMMCLIISVGGIKKIANNLGHKKREASLLCCKCVDQSVDGIKEITILQRRNSFVSKFENATEKRAEAIKKYDFIVACPAKIMETFFLSGMIVFMCIKVLLGEDMSLFIPKLSVFAYASFKILPSIASISSNITSLVYYRPSLQEVYNIVSPFSEEKIDDSNKAELSDFDFNKKIEINNVSWRYTGNDENTIENFSLVVNKGDSIALIGESGSGKSTFVDIILGLYTPQDGSICVDGISINTHSKAWADMIGYVPQMVYLMDDTIRNNIIFGYTDYKDGDRRIWEVLKKARLDEFVKSLPKGLDTIVGEKGIRLSGGQRQRLAMARALFGKPKLLVLDEATSALDNETEAAVMESINDLQGYVTMIIVAHRLTTITKCNRIFEVSNKKLVQRSISEIKDRIYEKKM